MKAKIVGLGLLFCLIGPLAITYLLLQFQKKQIRREVKQQMIAGIDKNDLVLLTFTQEEANKKLRWEHSKEFEFENNMYDVVIQESNGNTISFWCWLDHEETQLNKTLKTLFTLALHDHKQHRHQQENLLLFFKTLFLNKNICYNFFNNETITISTNYHNNLISWEFTPTIPPPEFG
ncbi:hypothetical protein [Aestuariibaculum suncheonense]|uniref:Uncharacterized protein n=1 Tax=Aestuariibaculum suncheonense TaxID=1028745 RepID=A0A8J6Q6D1_9FLAO|nr:hypothetical protein [Aestuariibaculum suncheonense]MBD0835054.1 hypothetical protein [Aestuariibaculum suncheonense]